LSVIKVEHATPLTISREQSKSSSQKNKRDSKISKQDQNIEEVESSPENQVEANIDENNETL
tara:strand:- start:345 stop:530 length:186 start_codon:yes stop_codon:yes gene_type:complete